MKNPTKILIVLLIISLSSFVVYNYFKSLEKPDIKTKNDISLDKPKENPLIITNESKPQECLESAGFYWCGLKQKCTRKWEELCISSTEETMIKETIKNGVIAKIGIGAGNVIVQISSAEENYAKGSFVLPNKNPEGAIWFAAKINGMWELVWGGNGTILCSDLLKYPDFPNKYIPECYNDKLAQLIKR